MLIKFGQRSLNQAIDIYHRTTQVMFLGYEPYQDGFGREDQFKAVSLN